MRRPAARRRRDAARQLRPARIERLGRAHRAGPVVPAAHDPRPARRGVRRAPPPGAARPRADGDVAALHRSPDRRHLPPRRRQQGLRPDARAHPVGRAQAVTPRRRVGRRARDRGRRARGRVRRAAQRRRGRADREGDPLADGRPDDLLRRPARAAQGARRPARRDARAAERRAAVGRWRRTRHRAAAGPERRRRSNRVARPRVRRRGGAAPARCRHVLRAVAVR